jgi:hypothetical protein
MAVLFDSSPGVLTPRSSPVTATSCAGHLRQPPPRQGHPGAWEALLAPEVVDRVRRLLTARQVDIEHQLAERGAAPEEFRHQCWEAGPAGRQTWFDREAEHHRWRSRALGVKRSIAYRLQAVKATAGAKGQQRVAEERRADRDPPCRLALAIDQHRQGGAEEGSTPSHTTKRCGMRSARSRCHMVAARSRCQ